MSSLSRRWIRSPPLSFEDSRVLTHFFGFIINPMEAALAHLALYVGNAGIAIILFTIGIRLVLSPLQILQLRSARAMQRLQPHIQELRKKHGKDKQKLTEETMKLYKEHKVNPAMGCLPMLLQFPVLIGLFWALRGLGSGLLDKHGKTIVVGPKFTHWLTSSYHYSHHVYTLYHAHFLWLSNGLGQPDPLYILPVLAGVTQWIQSRMMMQKSSDPQQQTMNMMMNFTPLIIVFFATRYASGLSLYWVTSTVIGILLSARITGWGSLPKLDQIKQLLGRPQPAAGFVSNKSKRLAKPEAAGSPKAQSNGQGNLLVPDAGGAENGVLENGSSNGDIANVDKTRPGNRQGNRRRSGRPRGGRRG